MGQRLKFLNLLKKLVVDTSTEKNKNRLKKVELALRMNRM